MVKSKQWEDWKRKQVKAVPHHARKRMKELLDSVPGPPKAWKGSMKGLRDIVEEVRRIRRRLG